MKYQRGDGGGMHHMAGNDQTDAVNPPAVAVLSEAAAGRDGRAVK